MSRELNLETPEREAFYSDRSVRSVFDVISDFL